MNSNTLDFYLLEIINSNNNNNILLYCNDINYINEEDLYYENNNLYLKNKKCFSFSKIKNGFYNLYVIGKIDKAKNGKKTEVLDFGQIKI